MKRCVALSAMTIFAAILSQLIPITSAEAQNIPAPNGRYSIARHGSLTLCSNPSTNAPEACSASGAVIAPVSDIATGSITYSSGVGCGTDTEVFNSLPPNTSPPMLNPETVVIKVTNYDSTTGIGTGSYTAYSGGSCTGADFDSSGASEEVTGTLEFVVTAGGKQVDVAITQLQSPINSLGSVSLFDTDLKQTQ
jgi:hypothetical protein